MLNLGKFNSKRNAISFFIFAITIIVVIVIIIFSQQNLPKERDIAREKDLSVLEDALNLYKIYNGDFPKGITENLTEICNTNVNKPNCLGLVNLSDINIEKLPVDPQKGILVGGTGYEIGLMEEGVMLNAPKAETKTISVKILEDDAEQEKRFWICGDDFTDERDDNVYKTAMIGRQCWMADNLAYLPFVNDPRRDSSISPYYYVYNYRGVDADVAKSTLNYQTYGVLYNWPAAKISCPEGWRLPTDTEYNVLENYLSTEACDASRDEEWSCRYAGERIKTSSWGGNNLSGFSALPAGHRATNGNFYYIDIYTGFWSSTEEEDSVWIRGVHLENSFIYRALREKTYGFSIRCIRE
jgi:uncharacterized protein (TIGR02145 family)